MAKSSITPKVSCSVLETLGIGIWVISKTPDGDGKGEMAKYQQPMPVISLALISCCFVCFEAE